jgi:hypothetical protein
LIIFFDALGPVSYACAWTPLAFRGKIVAEVTIMAYLRAYKAFQGAKKRAEDIVAAVQRAAASLKDWQQLKGGNSLSTGALLGGLPFDPKDWPPGSEISKAIQDHQNAHQALYKSWGALGPDAQLGLQPPPTP